MGGNPARGNGRDERPQAQAQRQLTDIVRKGYEPGTSALPDQRPVPRYAEHQDRSGGVRAAADPADEEAARAGGSGRRTPPPVQQARRKGLMPEAGAAGPPQDAPSEEPPGPASLDPDAAEGGGKP